MSASSAPIPQNTAAQETTSKKHRKRQLADLRAKLGDVQDAIDGGQLKIALNVLSQVNTDRKKCVDIEPELLAPIDKRIDVLGRSAAELKSWRKWAVTQSRERLQEKAQALVGLEKNPQALHKDVKKLRFAWRELDQSVGPAQEPLWQAFDETCKKADTPYVEWYKEEKKNQAKHKKERMKLCAYLAEWHEKPCNTADEWRELSKAVQSTKQAWFNAGSVSVGTWKKLQKKFKETLEPLESKLHVERDRDLRRREAIISKVESFDTENIKPQDLAELRQLERAWRPKVQAKRQVEKKLWDRFLKAKAPFDAHTKSERKEKSKQYKALKQTTNKTLADFSAAIDAFTKADDEAKRAEAKQTFLQAEKLWQTFERPPRPIVDKVRALKKQWVSVNKAFEKQQKSQTLELLVKASDVCAQRECGETLDDEQTAWLETHVHDLSLITSRLNKQTEYNESLFNETCLKLESLLGVDSPPEFEQARMALKMAMLQKAMQGQHDASVAINKAFERLLTLPVTTADQKVRAHNVLEATLTSLSHS